ncbi:MAG: hypothetical protein ACOY94_17420 [Bacillota bacterium]
MPFGKCATCGAFAKPWFFFAPIGLAAGAFDYPIAPGFAKFPPWGVI